jgi:EAL domain-containing protein (putative c-di-GMP-specific phosphodiesterase class I)
VNVSGRQLAGGELVEDVVHALGQSGLSPRALVLEVTETALVEDAERARAQLERLRRLGVRIAIDDFGTGWSSLSYLRQLPVDVLKVDRSFVATIEDDRSTPAILRGLLDLGRTLGLEVVAEGVERPEQHLRLVEEHCDRAQGFLYAHPLESADALALVCHGDVAVAHAPGVTRAVPS